MTVKQIRALGFDWPGSDSVEQYAVEAGGNVDLDATLAALRRGLEVYQGQLNDMQGFQRRWNADVGDPQGEVATKAAEMRRGIELVETIHKKTR